MTQKPKVANYVPELPIGKLKPAKFNPKTRVEQRRLSSLVKAIKAVGEILSPIIATPDGFVIDGHRRLAAAKQLKMATVPALLREMTAEERLSAYSSLNSSGLRTGSNDSLQVWLVEPTAVSPRYAMTFANMESQLGRPMLRKMAKQGYSPRLFSTAKRLLAYCSIDDNEFLRKTMEWLMKHSTARQVEQAMLIQAPAATLARAIRAGKPLKLMLVAE